MKDKIINIIKQSILVIISIPLVLLFIISIPFMLLINWYNTKFHINLQDNIIKISTKYYEHKYSKYLK